MTSSPDFRLSRSTFRLLLADLSLSFGCAFFCPLLLGLSTPALARLWTLPASENLQAEAQEALLLAEAGDTVVLPEGRFPMSVELSMVNPSVTLKGQGMDKTILVYGENAAGPQAIIATADDSRVEDLSIIDHPGDGIKMVGIDGATIRRVKVAWTREGSLENGAYGIYPVMSSNVLIEDSIVIGASDAGIYVGQSKNIIVRRNRAEFNVAGIEIENSQLADVYENIAMHNTGGILVFNLPNLLVQGGRGTRLFNNILRDNNLKNFAPAGNSVAAVPQGTGILILANDDVEIFGNTIEQHNTSSIAIANLHLLQLPLQDPNFDPMPEKIYIHHNKMRLAGRNPLKGFNQLGMIAAALSFPHPVPHIAYDGIGLTDAAGEAKGAQLQGLRRICLGPNEHDGGQHSYFGNLQLWKQNWWSPLPGSIERDFTAHSCELPRLPPVLLEAKVPTEAQERREKMPESEKSRLCQASDEGINWKAFAVDCPELSAYQLFQDPLNPLESPQEGGFPYDLSTPLFSDHASKSRLLFLPPGTQANYQEQAVFDLPLGAVLAKSFYFPLDQRLPAGPRRLVETRLLIHREQGWVGLVYLWDKDGQKARLIRGGSKQQLVWTDERAKMVAQEYYVPNLAQCSGCHLQNRPIGLKAGYLNRLGIGAFAGRSQLAELQKEGLLSGLPADLETVPRYPVWNQPSSGSLAARARSYLDINCAHCHSISGKGNTSGLFLNLAQAETINLGICKPPVAAGRGAGGTLFDIVPGQPEESILVQRMASTKAAIKMPELAKSLVHKEGVELISEWIASLPGECQS